MLSAHPPHPHTSHISHRAISQRKHRKQNVSYKLPFQLTCYNCGLVHSFIPTVTTQAFVVSPRKHEDKKEKYSGTFITPFFQASTVVEYQLTPQPVLNLLSSHTYPACQVTILQSKSIKKTSLKHVLSLVKIQTHWKLSVQRNLAHY